jgi:hypothetical protein
MSRIISFFVGLSLVYIPSLHAQQAPVAHDPVHPSALAGGAFGQEFRTPLIPPGGRLRSIQVKTNKKVTGLKIHLEDAQGQTCDLVTYGGQEDGGVWQKPFEIPKSAELVGISGSYGGILHAIRFHLSDGTQSQLYGDEVWFDFNISVANGDPQHPNHVIGFWGRYSSGQIHGLGLLIGAKDSGPN